MYGHRKEVIHLETEESSINIAWLFLAMNAVVVILFLLLSGCVDILDTGGTYPGPSPGPGTDPPVGNITLLEDPVVLVTGYDHTEDPMAVPYNEVHNLFAQVYTGSDLSVQLRDDIVEVMMQKVEELNESSTIFDHCIEEIYDDMDERPNMIPTYAEKCIFEGEDSWAIAFNRCNGFEDGIGHFDLYFISISTIESIYVTGCYGCDTTAILAEYHCRSPHKKSPSVSSCYHPISPLLSPSSPFCHPFISLITYPRW